ncbi:MAG: antibiotic biosynthesis monooxygenase [Bacteroidota bacterium]
MSYIYIWQFKVMAGKEKEFERAYGPEGDWVQLFRQSKGYLRTILVRTIADANTYLTIDEWISSADFLTFKKQFHDEYYTLDSRFSGLTTDEMQIGEFESVK